MSGPLPTWMRPFAAAASVGYGVAIHVRAKHLQDRLGDPPPQSRFTLPQIA